MYAPCCSNNPNLIVEDFGIYVKKRRQTAAILGQHDDQKKRCIKIMTSVDAGFTAHQKSFERLFGDVKKTTE